MADKRKTKFWWASVAGAECEPVEVTTLDGERVAYTCGCGDPFYLDRPDCPIELVPAKYTDGAMERALTPTQVTRAEKRRQRLIAKAMANGTHSWRGPR